MTEEEAKTKWCPHRVRYASPGLTSENSTSCIASACMAWRELVPAGTTNETSRRVPTGGFCGLAGEPR